MITYRKLKNLGDRLYWNSPLCSLEEQLGMRIQNLLDRGHDVESVHLKLKSDLEHDRTNGEDTGVLEDTIYYIENGKKRPKKGK